MFCGACGRKRSSFGSGSGSSSIKRYLDAIVAELLASVLRILAPLHQSSLFEAAINVLRIAK
jgi:hypothetical protein